MADRINDAALNTALDNGTLAYALLAELQFADGTVNIWGGPLGATISYDSKTWIGTGDLGEIAEIQETEGLGDNRLIATLHADSDMIDTVELEDNEGRVATFYILLFDTSTDAVIGALKTPFEMGQAWIEPALRIKQDGTQVIDLNIKMEFVPEGTIMARAHTRRLTDGDTKELDPADNFNEFAGDPDMGRGRIGRFNIGGKGGMESPFGIRNPGFNSGGLQAGPGIVIDIPPAPSSPLIY